jgi:hypothetical protein
MQGWNYGWMWICGLVLIVALVLILRARYNQAARRGEYSQAMEQS